jgi:hypothetical protein
LIELGGLVQKSGLVELTSDDRALLYGAFLELAYILKSETREQTIAVWRRRGSRAFKTEKVAPVALQPMKLGGALRPDSFCKPRRTGAVKGCNRLRRARQRASFDGSEHRGRFAPGITVLFAVRRKGRSRQAESCALNAGFSVL